MNGLIQQKSFLIGTQNEIDPLAKRERAVLLAISDSHGDKFTFRKILEKEGAAADALVFCGDGISDLLYCLEAASADKAFMQCIPPVIAFVEGNGDSDRYPAKLCAEEKTNDISSYTNILIPVEQLFTAAKHNIFVTHGHRFDVYYGTEMISSRARALGAQVTIYGHTHISSAEDRNGMLVLNPGSCSRPRGGQSPSYAIISLSSKPSSCTYKIISVS